MLREPGTFDVLISLYPVPHITTQLAVGAFRLLRFRKEKRACSMQVKCVGPLLNEELTRYTSGIVAAQL